MRRRRWRGGGSGKKERGEEEKKGFWRVGVGVGMGVSGGQGEGRVIMTRTTTHFERLGITEGKTFEPVCTLHSSIQAQLVDSLLLTAYKKISNTYCVERTGYLLYPRCFASKERK